MVARFIVELISEDRKENIMTGRVLMRVLGVGVLFSMIFAVGCGPQADLALKFEPQDAATYEVKTDIIKMFKFEQPSVNKVKEDETSTEIKVRFLQEIQQVDNAGGAIAKITLKGIKYRAVEKSEEKFDFDSDREADKSDNFAKLIGQSYKIRIAPDGVITVVDAKAARAAVKGGYEGTVAKGLLKDEMIVQRHEVPGLPESERSALGKGDSWSKVKGSPPGLLAPKSYEKIYTLTDTKEGGGKTVAVVNMSAATSEKAAPDQPKASTGMGPFAKMFDTEEKYTGKLMLDLDTGKVLKYNEKLDVKYIATEEPAEQKSDKGLDTLTMGFVYAVSMELVD